MRLGSGEHYGWEEPRTARLVRLFDGDRPEQYAWVEVPAGAKGGPLDLVVTPRHAAPSVVPAAGHRVQVAAWVLDAKEVARLTACVERVGTTGTEQPWSPPTPLPGLWLWLEQPRGAGLVPARFPRGSDETGTASDRVPWQRLQRHRGVSFVAAPDRAAALPPEAALVKAPEQSTGRPRMRLVATLVTSIHLEPSRTDASGDATFVVVGDAGHLIDPEDGGPAQVWFESGVTLEERGWWADGERRLRLLWQIDPVLEEPWTVEQVRRAVLRAGS